MDFFFSFAGDYTGRPVVVMKEAVLCRSPMSRTTCSALLLPLARNPYSKWGLTTPWYTVFRMFSLALQVVPESVFLVASFLLALVFAFCRWGFHVCFLSQVAPRYVSSSSSCNGTSPSVRMAAKQNGQNNCKLKIIYVMWSETGLEHFCRINKQLEVTALEQLTSHEQPRNNRDPSRLR